jgi:hypothetical protein
MWEANGKIITLLISKNRDKCEILCKQNNQEVKNFSPCGSPEGKSLEKIQHRMNYVKKEWKKHHNSRVGTWNVQTRCSQM